MMLEDADNKIRIRGGDTIKEPKSVKASSCVFGESNALGNVARY